MTTHISPTARLRAAFDQHRSSARAARIARAERAQLEHELAQYTTDSERAEMGAILNRYPESETHRAWESVLVSSAR